MRTEEEEDGWLCREWLKKEKEKEMMKAASATAAAAAAPTSKYHLI